MAAVQMNDVGDMPCFDCTESGGLAQRWQRWLRAFELYSTGRGVVNVAQKKALLLHKAGMKVQDIYYTLPDEVALEGENAYGMTVRVLNRFFRPHTNTPFERHVFRNMVQLQTETVEQYATRLRQQSETCDFGNWNAVSERIRDQIIDKCSSSSLRRKLLERGTALTLEQMLDIARVSEDTEKQVKSFEGLRSEVNKLSFKNKSSGASRGRGKSRGPKRGCCYSCGYEGHMHKDPKCPAKGKQCNKCQAFGHFESCCKTKQSGSREKSTRGRGRGRESSQSDVKQVHHTDEDQREDEYAFSVEHERAEDDAEIRVMVGGVPLIMSIDSGATINVIDTRMWEKLKVEGVKCMSKKSTKNVYAYGSKETLPVAGTFVANIAVDNQEIESAEFVVIHGEGQALLGRKSAIQLGVLRLGPRVHAVQADSDINIRQEYSDCFEGFGKLKDFQLEIPVDPDVTPVISPLRRVPYQLRDKLSKKLDELESMDIIEKVNKPSAWVSPVVVVPKGQNDIRLCIDMRLANESVKRVRHFIPTIDEVLQDFNQSRVFSKLDIKWAYHQIELLPESREITTFITHKGLYRYKRLLFGITCAPEMYQKVLQQVLQGCEGAQNILDDIIVHAATEEEHNRRLRQVLDVIRKSGLTLNPDKCLFKLPKLQFMGHVLSARGIGPTKEKVQAVQEARAPANASEVRSFLGLVNFTARYIENLATVSEPLRKLTRKDEPFIWGPEQQRAFQTLKDRLASSETLAYFDKESKTQVIADAGPVGLGAVLVQHQQGEYRVVCYASKSLTDIERRYSQTEKEALALVWACERFHAYLYGAEFELITDHKPLQFIYSPRSKPSARIERWVLRMQPYMYTVKHVAGRNNIADCLSRLLKVDRKPCDEVKTEEYVRFIAQESTPVALTTKQIERESEYDPELMEVRRCLLDGKWYKMDNKQFVPIKNELSAVGKLVLRGTRIIIPSVLRKQVIELAHEGHPGIVKMKDRLRSKVWWPGIDRDAERFCRTCFGCQVVSQPSPPTPMTRTEMPTAPWQHLAADLLGPLPSGDYIFVVVDYYSRFFEIEITKVTTTDRIVSALSKIFLTHGLPLSIQTDNGPQFISEQFREYLEENGISHRKTTPLWPQANGEVERQNRSILKRIKIAQAERRDWKKELNNYLVMYRSTPHSTTGKSPAELLFRRTIRTKIPEIQEFQEDIEVRDRDNEQKGKGKEYADQKRRACESELQKGDCVLLKQSRENKWSTPFNPSPCTVVERSGNSVVVETSQGVQYKRNVTAVKKFHERSEEESCVSIKNQNLPSEDSVKQSKFVNENVSGEIEFRGSQFESNQNATPRKVTIPVAERTVLSSPRPTRQRRLPVKFDDFIVGTVRIS